MQTLLEGVLLLILLVLVLRVSLTRGRHAVRLRGGLVALNIVTGILCGVVLAVGLRDLWPAVAAAADPAARQAANPGAATLGAAVRHLLPLVGAVLGGIAGFVLLGGVWRRLFQDGSASARNGLRRAQFLASGAAAAALAIRIFR